MSQTARQMMNEILQAQMSVDSPFVQSAVIVQNSSQQTVTGWFDEYTEHADKDGGNVYQGRKVKRFLTASSFSVDVYDEPTLVVTNDDETTTSYKINNVDYDTTGVKVLWLY